MGIAEEYAKKVKKPLIIAFIIKPWGNDPPSIDSGGDRYSVEVVSCSTNFNFDQATSSCSLEIKSPRDLNGNYIKFEPMDRVTIFQGWNSSSTYQIVFFGFVDSVQYANPPQTQRLECRDILKLAQDNYLIHSNRKIYSAVVQDDELDDEGQPMGGQFVFNRTAQAIIADLLSESGIPSYRLRLDFPFYLASGAIIFGTNTPAKFVYESALDGVTRLCDLFDYRIWADPVGTVQCREVRAIAATSPTLFYNSQEEVYNEDTGSFDITVTGNLLSLSVDVSDDLRNWVTVIGYDDLTSTVVGDSDYVPDPPRYRRTEIRSYLLDTQELVETVAEQVFVDLNRLRYTGKATIEGDPRLRIGQTVSVSDPHVTQGEAISFFLYGYTSEFRAGEWTMELDLAGGVGSGSLPIGNISPVALFYAEVDREYISNQWVFDVFVNAYNSYDPNGAFEDLTFVWVASGYDTLSGFYPTNVYTVSGVSSITIDLTVYDQGVPQLSSSYEQTITLGAGEQIESRMVYVASEQYVYVTDNGGGTWVQRTLY